MEMVTNTCFYSDTIADYLTNFMCFVALSIEIFSILLFTILSDMLQ